MNPKQRTIIFLIIFGIVITGLLGFIIYFQLRGISRASEELIAEKKELILFQKRMGQLEQFKKTYKELEPNLKKMDNLFVDPEVPIDLIKFWENVAEKRGLSIEISPAIIRSLSSAPWNSMGFQIVLAGSFSDFLKFLEKIENSPNLIEIQSLALKKQEEISRNEIRATLLTKVFTR